MCRLLEFSFIETGLLIASSVLILIGTFLISKSIFLTAVASEHWLRRDKLGSKWKLVGFCLGISANNWTEIFMSGDQLTPSQIKRIRDPFVPLKGFMLVFFGTLAQFLISWCKNL